MTIRIRYPFSFPGGGVPDLDEAHNTLCHGEMETEHKALDISTAIRESTVFEDGAWIGDLIVAIELKLRNPKFGCMHIAQTKGSLWSPNLFRSDSSCAGPPSSTPAWLDQYACQKHSRSLF
jgi:hypothetical protein